MRRTADVSLEAADKVGFTDAAHLSKVVQRNVIGKMTVNVRQCRCKQLAHDGGSHGLRCQTAQNAVDGNGNLVLVHGGKLRAHAVLRRVHNRAELVLERQHRLPGDLSSSSRFVRVAFTKIHAISGESEKESVSQFFHILGSVDQQRGCCEVADGKYEITLYTSCCNVTKGIYYYNTYENHQISAVDMYAEDLDGNNLICYPVIQGEQINYQNK